MKRLLTVLLISVAVFVLAAKEYAHEVYWTPVHRQCGVLLDGDPLKVDLSASSDCISLENRIAIESANPFWVFADHSDWKAR